MGNLRHKPEEVVVEFLLLEAPLFRAARRKLFEVLPPP